MQHFNHVVYSAALWFPAAFIVVMFCPFTWGSKSLRKRQP